VNFERDCELIQCIHTASVIYLPHRKWQKMRYSKFNKRIESAKWANLKQAKKYISGHNFEKLLASVDAYREIIKILKKNLSSNTKSIKRVETTPKPNLACAGNKLMNDVITIQISISSTSQEIIEHLP